MILKPKRRRRIKRPVSARPATNFDGFDDVEDWMLSQGSSEK